MLKPPEKHKVKDPDTSQNSSESELPEIQILRMNNKIKQHEKDNDWFLLLSAYPSTQKHRI
jgi:hypothetical protein